MSRVLVVTAATAVVPEELVALRGGGRVICETYLVV
jgi:hypothetical protein